MTVTIWHNPGCSTSRKVLERLQTAGLEPVVVNYLKIGWTAEGLHALFIAAGVPPQAALRRRAAEADALGLTAPGVTDEALIAAMLAHPVLVERPFVQTPKGTALCRPAERVEDLLP